MGDGNKDFTLLPLVQTNAHVTNGCILIGSIARSMEAIPRTDSKSNFLMTPENPGVSLLRRLSETNLVSNLFAGPNPSAGSVDSMTEEEDSERRASVNSERRRGSKLAELLERKTKPKEKKKVWKDKQGK